MVMIFIFDDSFPAMALRLSIIELGGHIMVKKFCFGAFVLCSVSGRREEKRKEPLEAIRCDVLHCCEINELLCCY